MNIDKYLVTEFIGNTLALRKPNNAIFSDEEIESIKEEMEDMAQLRFLFTGNKLSHIGLIVCNFFDDKQFHLQIEKQAEKFSEIDEKKFVICGFNYDAFRDEYSLTFYANDYEKFSDAEMLFFATEMHKHGAITVYNWHNGVSTLRHRLTSAFDSLLDTFIIPPVRKLTCSFKNDEAGRHAVAELFKKYSKFSESLENECYESCVLTAFNKQGTFILLNNSNYLTRFSTEELTKICNWLYSLGATHVSPNCYVSDRTLICNTIECSFAPTENWNQKLKAFTDYNEQSYIQALKFLEIISKDATEYSPNWNITIVAKGIALNVVKEALESEKLSRKERFYFLNKFLSFGAIEIATKNHSIYCEFSKDENGRKLRNDAVWSLIQ